MKIIAFYLPQFHTIPENDEWWGKGFTEWTNVKKATSLFPGHKQPKVPLNNNYYNLLDDKVKIWQANIAKKYGIYGFCYYHYWYNGHMLLEKPMEQMLANKEVNIPFCIWWCNQPWTKSWVGSDNKVLISQKYGGRDEWIEHYKYLRQFFLDKRYILLDNKPIIGIYQPDTIVAVKEMKICWDNLAQADGFDGIHLMCTVKSYDSIVINKSLYDNFDSYVEWGFSLAADKYFKQSRNGLLRIIHLLKNKLFNVYEKLFGHKPIFIEKILSLIRMKNNSINKQVIKYDYDTFWDLTLALKPYSKKSIPGAFVNWDNTARYGMNGSVMVNVSCEKFKNYLSKQIKNAKENYKSDFIFLQAWNEWAEWSVLEPDADNGYSYLKAVKEAIDENH